MRRGRLTARDRSRVVGAIDNVRNECPSEIAADAPAAAVPQPTNALVLRPEIPWTWRRYQLVTRPVLSARCRSRAAGRTTQPA